MLVCFAFDAPLETDFFFIADARAPGTSPALRVVRVAFAMTRLTRAIEQDLAWHEVTREAGARGVTCAKKRVTPVLSFVEVLFLVMDFPSARGGGGGGFSLQKPPRKGQ